MPLGSEDFAKLLPDRRSQYVFFARLLALIVMTGIWTLYVWWQVAAPNASQVATTQMSPPDTTAELSSVQAMLQALPVDSLPQASPSDENSAPSATLPPGMLAQDVQIVSQDGLASFRLPKGTLVLDPIGQPPATLTVTARELPLRTDIGLVGMAYEFGPEGVTLNPPAALTITFDHKSFYPFKYQDIDCGHMHMAFYDWKTVTTFNNSRGGPVVPWLDVTVNSVTHSATTKIDHLGTVILFCEVFTLPQS